MTDNDKILVLNDEEISALSDDDVEKLARGYVTTLTRISIMKERDKRRKEGR